MERTAGLLCRALEGRGKVYDLLGDYSSAEKDFSRILVSKMEPIARSHACMGIGQLYLKRSTLDDAQHWCKKSLNISKKHFFHLETIRAYSLAAQVFYRRGQFDEAHNCLAKAGGLAKYLIQRSKKRTARKKYVHEAARVRSLTAIVYCMEGKYLSAIPLKKSALAAFRRSGDLWNQSVVLTNLGNIFNETGKYEKALGYYDMSLEIKRRIGDLYGEGTTLHNISKALSMLGHSKQALHFARQGLEISRRVGDKSGVAVSHLAIGIHCRNIGNYKEALGSYRQSMRLCRQINEPYITAANLINIAHLNLAQGQFSKCKASISKAEKVLRSVQNPYLLAHALTIKADLYWQQGSPTKACQYIEESLSICCKCNLTTDEIWALCLLVRIIARHKKLGQYSLDMAAGLIAKLKLLAGKTGNIEMVIAYLQAQGEYSLAIEDLRNAERIGERLHRLASQYDHVTLFPYVHFYLARVRHAIGKNYQRLLEKSMQLAVQMNQRQLLSEIRSWRHHVAGQGEGNCSSK